MRGQRKSTVEERFWAKVDKRGNDECWEWLAYKDAQGYGRFRYGGRDGFAHRAAWVIAGNPDITFPENHLDHQCWNRGCVNPGHLAVVTPSENAQNRGELSLANTSGARGVHWRPDRQRWVASVHYGGKRYYAGLHRNKEDAEQAVIELRNRIFTNNLRDRNAA